MLGKRSDEVKRYQMVTMEDLVPVGHILRRLRDALDPSFVREMVADRYSGIGRPSIDPEVVVRMLVLQYLFDFSERRICDEVRMHGGYRWFCDLSFNDRVPDQSTLVKLRGHAWAGAYVASGLYANVPLAWCAIVDAYVKNQAVFVCPSDAWAPSSGRHSCIYDGLPRSVRDASGQEVGGAFVD